jgi:hypothetical protein
VSECEPLHTQGRTSSHFGLRPRLRVVGEDGEAALLFTFWVCLLSIGRRFFRLLLVPFQGWQLSAYSLSREFDSISDNI